VVIIPAKLLAHNPVLNATQTILSMPILVYALCLIPTSVIGERRSRRQFKEDMERLRIQNMVLEYLIELHQKGALTTQPTTPSNFERIKQ
jgi:hypothetical protein